jgi:chromosome segregation ATPase
MSGTYWSLVEPTAKKLNVVWKDLGDFRLKGLESDERLLSLVPKVFANRTFPELRQNDPPVVKKLNEELFLLKSQNQQLQAKLTFLQDQLDQVNDSINGVSIRLNTLRRIDNSQEISEMFESVETIVSAQDNLSNMVQSIGSDKENVMKQLTGMQSEFSELKALLNIGKLEL